MVFKNLEDMMNTINQDISKTMDKVAKDISEDFILRNNKIVEISEKNIKLIENDEYEFKPYERYNEPYCNGCGNEDFPKGFRFDNSYANAKRYMCKQCDEILWVDGEFEQYMK